MLIKNYTFNFFKYINLFLLLMTINIAHSAYATCNVAIYNTSNESLTVKFIPDDYDGEVHFIDIDPKQCSNNQIINGPCTLDPHQVVKIDYTTYGDSIGGAVQLTYISNKSSVNVSYDNKHGSCPKLVSSSSNIQLNSPSDGFIVIQQNLGAIN